MTTYRDRHLAGHYDSANQAEEPQDTAAGYDAMTKDELQAELEQRSLPISGNKPELIERLEDDDNATVA